MIGRRSTRKGAESWDEKRIRGPLTKPSARARPSHPQMSRRWPAWMSQPDGASMTMYVLAPCRSVETRWLRRSAYRGGPRPSISIVWPSWDCYQSRSHVAPGAAVRAPDVQPSFTSAPLMRSQSRCPRDTTTSPDIFLPVPWPRPNSQASLRARSLTSGRGTSVGPWRANSHAGVSSQSNESSPARPKPAP